jgi:hypothetical protein
MIFSSVIFDWVTLLEMISVARLKERSVDGVCGNAEVRANAELARRLGPIRVQILGGTS